MVVVFWIVLSVFFTAVVVLYVILRKCRGNAADVIEITVRHDSASSMEMSAGAVVG